MKTMRTTDWYLTTVMGILAFTAGLKGLTILQALGAGGPPGASAFLALPAPFLGALTNGQLLFVAAVFELVVVGALFVLPEPRLRLAVVAWVGGLFTAYHVGLHLIGYQLPCGCLGSPMAEWPVPQWTSDVLTALIIVYLLVGGYGGLLWHGRRAPAPAREPSGTNQERPHARWPAQR